MIRHLLLAMASLFLVVGAAEAANKRPVVLSSTTGRPQELQSGDTLVDQSGTAYSTGATPNLTGSTGIVAQTGASTYSARTLTGPAAGISIANGSGVAGNPTFSLANDLAALEGLSSTGLSARTGTDTWAIRSLAAPAAGFTITNSDAVSGNPTFVLANDLAALEGLSSTGFAVRTTTDTWAQRSFSAGSAFSWTNSDGVSGNPSIDFATITSGHLLANSGAGTAAPADTTLTALIDRAISSTRGCVLERGASTWGTVCPGTSGFALISNGSSADPSYQSVPAAGLPAYVRAASASTLMAGFGGI